MTINHDSHDHDRDDAPVCPVCGEQVADADHHACARPQGATP